MCILKPWPKKFFGVCIYQLAYQLLKYKDFDSLNIRECSRIVLEKFNSPVQLFISE